MSYQPPYSSGNFDNQASYASPDQQLRAPARRASTVLLVIGGLSLLAAMCMTVVFVKGPIDQLVNQPGMQIPKIPGKTDVEVLRLFVLVIGIGALVVGVVSVVLGLLVRGGGRASVICSIVFGSLLGIFLLWNAGGALLLVGQNPTTAIMGFLMTTIPLLLTGLMLFWLAQAVRNAGTLQRQKRALESQMWQLQQQRSTASATGYGYAAPPLPPGAPPIDPRGALPGGGPPPQPPTA